jgi:ketosteroid isomerase-like protein
MSFPKLLLLVAIPGLLFAQAAEPSRSNPQSEKAVLNLENEFLAAVLKSDATAVARTITDDFYFVGPDGLPQDKTAFTAPIKSGDLKMTSSVASDIVVHFSSANMVILTYRSADRGSFKGAEFSGDYRWTDVAVKRDGRWQFLCAHGAQISTPKP